MGCTWHGKENDAGRRVSRLLYVFNVDAGHGGEGYLREKILRGKVTESSYTAPVAAPGPGFVTFQNA